MGEGELLGFGADSFEGHTVRASPRRCPACIESYTTGEAEDVVLAMGILLVTHPSRAGLLLLSVPTVLAGESQTLHNATRSGDTACLQLTLGTWRKSEPQGQWSRQFYGAAC